MNHIGERIKHLRKSRNMTQEELGQILGVKKAAVQKYESSADPNLTADKIRILCSTFDAYSRTFVFTEEYEIWEAICKFCESELLRLQPNLRASSTNLAAEKHIDTEPLVNQIGKSHLALLSSLLGLNGEGFERVKTYANDLLRIEEYRR